jgi:hypothetical protein
MPAIERRCKAPLPLSGRLCPRMDRVCNNLWTFDLKLFEILNLKTIIPIFLNFFKKIFVFFFT